MDVKWKRRGAMMMFPTGLGLLCAGTMAAVAEIPVIDDREILAAFVARVGEFAERGDLPDSDDLKRQAAGAPEVFESDRPLPLASEAAVDPGRSVYVFGSVYQCDKCDEWHVGGLATAWALTTDGLMVTNQHVFRNPRGAAMGVVDRDGRAHPVVEILAADEAADVAVFRVESESLTPLPLGPPAAVGSRVRVISHPQRRFFTQTFGDVSRYHARPARGNRGESTWMSITADYAKGSSGGPVLDADNRVVGMVASTRSIYYDSNNGQPEGPLQMVVKNSVPIAAIMRVLGLAASSETASPGPAVRAGL